MAFKALALSLLLLACHEQKLVQVPPCEPSEEVCDGRDNDCDGEVDEWVSRDCSNQCESGYQWCRNGRWEQCSARVPRPEICDLVDNDCDGMVDEGLAVTPCYRLGLDHPSLQYGACHPGSQRCVYGKEQCVNDQVPAMETCNGLDDNCDGRVDEGTGGSTLDLVFAVDYSGSMAPVIRDLITATSSWASKYASRQDIKIALVGIPRDDPAGDCRTTVMLNFSTPADFAAELARHPSAIGGGIEPQLDAIYMTAIPQNPLNLRWTPGSNHAIVVYTDEMPQTYGNPMVVTNQMAWTAAVDNGLRTFVFTSDSDWQSWSPRPLNLPANVLETELDKVIEEAACSGM